MSLLTVAQAVAEEVGLPAPSVVASSSNKTAKQLFRLINRAGKLLAKKDWTILQKEHTFATVDGTASYDLPSDYARMLGGTVWNRDSYWQQRGPLSAKEWQVKKSALVASASLRQNFRVKPDTRVNKFFIDPTPSAAEDCVFEYVSTDWVKTTNNSDGKAAYSLDTDISLIDEELLELEAIWRFLSRKGFAYAEEKEEAVRAIDMAFASDFGVSVIDFGAPRGGSPLNVPEGNFPEA